MRSERALHDIADTAAGYVRGHPLQSVVVAAGTGAAGAVLLSLLMGNRDGNRH